jgi:putative transposase
MPQSLALVIVHIIFSSKERRPFLSEDIRPRIHAYLATVARDHDCECFCVGGVADHVHLAVRLSRTITIAQLVEKLKTSSSAWVKRQPPKLDSFAWQNGYAAFSVSPGNLDALRKYIETQAEHHKRRDFREEIQALFRQYGVEFDERYVWD